MADSVTAQPRTSLMTNRNYRLLWSGQSLSIIGDYFFSATLILWIIDQLARGAPWLPLATGAVALSLVLPSLVIGPIAGVWVDCWNRRWTMLWTDALRLVLVALFLLMAFIVSNHTVLLISSLVTLVLACAGSEFKGEQRVSLRRRDQSYCIQMPGCGEALDEEDGGIRYLYALWQVEPVYPSPVSYPAGAYVVTNAAPFRDEQIKDAWCHP